MDAGTQPLEKVVATQTHGRYLVRPGTDTSVLVGFHGYGETAEAQLARLDAIAEAGEWLRISIQGLHRFYDRRTDSVVASWMTRQDREHAIADNAAYVARVLEHVIPQVVVPTTMVFAGFSQGVAMAFRAAAAAKGRSHVVAVGGDVPPELTPSDLGRLGSVLLCRGADDPWYGDDKFQSDLQRLQGTNVPVDALTVAGGHEWSAAVSAAVDSYLNTHTVRRQ